ncbi:MAG: hypothetical protein Q8K91_12990 [Hylemonella sp.]|nr:hypothetical protein [Hylemonella sp.]MDP1938114.1 hypothetical protein [Hylemonella sp.]
MIKKPNWIIGHPVWTQGQFTRLGSIQFPLEVRLPEVGPIEHMVSGTVPTSIMVGFEPAANLPVHQTADGGGNFDILGALFMAFYDTGKEWLDANVSKEAKKWPSIWRFGRVVRNSIAHGGKLFITNSNAAPENWYALTYSPALNGKRIFSTDLAPADLLVLLFEMSDSLDALGAPLPPWLSDKQRSGEQSRSENGQ